MPSKKKNKKRKEKDNEEEILISNECDYYDKKLSDSETVEALEEAIEEINNKIDFLENYKYKSDLPHWVIYNRIDVYKYTILPPFYYKLEEKEDEELITLIEEYKEEFKTSHSIESIDEHIKKYVSYSRTLFLDSEYKRKKSKIIYNLILRTFYLKQARLTKMKYRKEVNREINIDYFPDLEKKVYQKLLLKNRLFSWRCQDNCVICGNPSFQPVSFRVEIGKEDCPVKNKCCLVCTRNHLQHQIKSQSLNKKGTVNIRCLYNCCNGKLGVGDRLIYLYGKIPRKSYDFADLDEWKHSFKQGQLNMKCGRCKKISTSFGEFLEHNRSLCSFSKMSLLLK